MKLLTSVAVACPHCGGDGVTHIEVACLDLEEYLYWNLEEKGGEGIAPTSQ